MFVAFALAHNIKMKSRTLPTILGLLITLKVLAVNEPQKLNATRTIFLESFQPFSTPPDSNSKSTSLLFSNYTGTAFAGT